LKQVVAAVSSVLPASLTNMGVTSDAEDQYYQEEVKQLKEWRYTKRPFTAEQIASKRGNLPIQYPSNAMSKKLWKNLEEKFAVRIDRHAFSMEKGY
jgi:isocitrate lyase